MVDVGGISVVFSIGETVTWKNAIATIGNIGFRDKNGNFVGADQGVLNYMLLNDKKESLGWVPATDVVVPDMAVEVEDGKATAFYDQDEHSPHLLDLGYSIVSWLDGLESRPDNDKLPSIITLLMAIQYDKEGFYGSSWKGKGEYRGIMSNIDRKYDRLDKMTEDELNGSIQTLVQIEQLLSTGKIDPNQVSESKIDAIADLANYCLLYMTYVKDNFPNVFNVWVKRNIPKYLKNKIPFIQDSTANTSK